MLRILQAVIKATSDPLYKARQRTLASVLAVKGRPIREEPGEPQDLLVLHDVAFCGVLKAGMFESLR
eukprot:8397344-Alexandrium_andersonii.AAC.1